MSLGLVHELNVRLALGTDGSWAPTSAALWLVSLWNGGSCPQLQCQPQSPREQKGIAWLPLCPDVSWEDRPAFAQSWWERHMGHVTSARTQVAGSRAIGFFGSLETKLGPEAHLRQFQRSLSASWSLRTAGLKDVSGPG